MAVDYLLMIALWTGCIATISAILAGACALQKSWLTSEKSVIAETNSNKEQNLYEERRETPNRTVSKVGVDQANNPGAADIGSPQKDDQFDADDHDKEGWFKHFISSQSTTNWLLAIATVGLAFLAFGQLSTSRDAAKRQLKAYVRIASVSLTDIDPGAKAKVRIVIRNGGLTPADVTIDDHFLPSIDSKVIDREIGKPSNHPQPQKTIDRESTDFFEFEYPVDPTNNQSFAACGSVRAIDVYGETKTLTYRYKFYLGTEDSFKLDKITEQPLQTNNDSQGGNQRSSTANDGHNPSDQQIPIANLDASKEQQASESNNDAHTTGNKNEGIHISTLLGTQATNWLMAGFTGLLVVCSG